MRKKEKQGKNKCKAKAVLNRRYINGNRPHGLSAAAGCCFSDIVLRGFVADVHILVIIA